MTERAECNKKSSVVLSLRCPYIAFDWPAQQAGSKLRSTAGHKRVTAGQG